MLSPRQRLMISYGLAALAQLAVLRIGLAGHLWLAFTLAAVQGVVLIGWRELSRGRRWTQQLRDIPDAAALRDWRSTAIRVERARDRATALEGRAVRERLDRMLSASTRVAPIVAELSARAGLVQRPLVMIRTDGRAGGGASTAAAGGQRGVIWLQAALVETESEAVLRAVIGHELGHLAVWPAEERRTRQRLWIAIGLGLAVHAAVVASLPLALLLPTRMVIDGMAGLLAAAALRRVEQAADDFSVRLDPAHAAALADYFSAQIANCDRATRRLHRPRIARMRLAAALVR